MNNKKIMVSELDGALLDYWVARAQGIPAEHVEIDRGVHCRVYLPNERRGDELGILLDAFLPGEWRIYRPHVWWSNGGPIIERDGIGLLSPKQSPCGQWHASYLHPDCADNTGPTPLIAAMRAYVASKFGDTVPGEVQP